MIVDNRLRVTMDAVLFILRILIAVALYAFLGTLLWVLLRGRASGPIGSAPTARLIQIHEIGQDRGDKADKAEDMGRAYAVQTAAWIGRDPNCLVHTDDDFASARHAQVLWRAEDGTNGAWWVEDNLSRNGTFVNEARVSNAKLNDGDVIRVGRMSFRFQTIGH